MLLVIADRPSLSMVRLFRAALQLVRPHAGTLVVLALLPLLPLALFGPLLAEAAKVVNLVPPEALLNAVSPWTVAVALLGLGLSVLVTVAAAAGMFHLFGEDENPGVTAVFAVGARRLGAVLWTEFLLLLAVLLALAPSLLLLGWTSRSFGAVLAADPWFFTGVAVVALLLALPALVVVAWYALAPILAARGDAAGRRALVVSHRLVAGSALRVVGALLGLVLGEWIWSVALSLLFPGLALFRALLLSVTVPVVGNAYLFALYAALRGNAP